MRTIRQIMTKSIANILIAAFLVAIAGPALAKKQVTVDTQSAKAQTKRQAAKTCRRMPPPFMYNPRYMNRGFFKGKCRTPSQ